MNHSDSRDVVAAPPNPQDFVGKVVFIIVYEDGGLIFHGWHTTRESAQREIDFFANSLHWAPDPCRHCGEDRGEKRDNPWKRARIETFTIMRTDS